MAADVQAEEQVGFLGNCCQCSANAIWSLYREALTRLLELKQDSSTVECYAETLKLCNLRDIHAQYRI